MAISTIITYWTAIKTLLNFGELGWKVFMFICNSKENKLNKIIEQEKKYDIKYKELWDSFIDFNQHYKLQSPHSLLKTDRKKILQIFSELMEEFKYLLLFSQFYSTEKERIFNEHIENFIRYVSKLLIVVNDPILLDILNESKYRFTKHDSTVLRNFLSNYRENRSKSDSFLEKINQLHSSYSL